MWKVEKRENECIWRNRGEEDWYSELRVYRDDEFGEFCVEYVFCVCLWRRWRNKIEICITTQIYPKLQNQRLQSLIHELLETLHSNHPINPKRNNYLKPLQNPIHKFSCPRPHDTRPRSFSLKISGVLPIKRIWRLKTALQNFEFLLDQPERKTQK